MEEKRPNQCVVAGCQLDKYEEHDKCILHCEKSSESHYANFDDLLFVLPVKTNKDNVVTLTAIHFPHDFNFSNSLNGHAEHYNFSDCHFNCYIDFSGSTFPNLRFNFYTCTFHEDVNFHDLEFSPRISGCIFKSDVEINANVKNNVIPYIVHSEFKNVLSIRFLSENHNFTFIQNKHNFINKICFENSIISKKVLPILFTKEIELIDTTVHSNIEIIPEKELSLKIINSTIYGLLNIKSIENNQNIINSFHSQNCTFNGIVSMTNCNFTSQLDFNHVIFNSTSNFSGSRFLKPLDISKITFGFLPCFIDCYINESSPRETFRLIKYSFDSIGNTIEANNYFALEMDKLYSELNWKNNFSEKLLLAINKCTSNFGQNWWLPILWIFGFASMFYFLRKYDPFDYPFLNGIASFIIPYQGIIGTTHQMSKLLTSILFGVLIYQTTVALKRKTRR